MPLTKVTPSGLSNLNVSNCRLAFVSSTEVRLSPYKGNGLNIGGDLQVIPSAGVSLANTGLTAATLYYVYAFMSGTTITLEASVTGHSTSTTTGVEIKTGSETHTLVGMVYMGAGTPGTFINSATQRYIRSWFNDRGISCLNTFSADRSTASATYVELNTEIRCEFLTWGSEQCFVSTAGGFTNATASTMGHAVTFDGITATLGLEMTTYIVAGAQNSVSMGGNKSGLTEGYHYATIAAKTTAGTTTLYGASTPKVYLHIITPGNM